MAPLATWERTRPHPVPASPGDGDRLAAKDAPGQPLSRVYPHLAGFADMEILGMDRVPELIAGSDLVFSALPHGLSAPVARQALAAGKRMIDMAADFRLPDQALYEQWYQSAHEAPDPAGEAVYGLPELFRSAVAGARLVANPGCYPTSALLALAPAAEARPGGAGLPDRRLQVRSLRRWPHPGPGQPLL